MNPAGNGLSWDTESIPLFPAAQTWAFSRPSPGEIPALLPGMSWEVVPGAALDHPQAVPSSCCPAGAAGADGTGMRKTGDAWDPRPRNPGICPPIPANNSSCMGQHWEGELSTHSSTHHLQSLGKSPCSTWGGDRERQSLGDSTVSPEGTALPRHPQHPEPAVTSSVMEL